MWPGVGTRSQKPHKRWMGTASDPLARRVETNSTTSGQAQQSAALPQPRRSGPETARLPSPALAPRVASTDRPCCWLTSSMMSSAGSSTGWHVVQSRDLRPGAQGLSVRSRHRTPLLVPPQRQAVKPGTVCSETKRRTG